MLPFPDRPTHTITLSQEGEWLVLTFPWDDSIKALINALPGSDRYWESPYRVLFSPEIVDVIRSEIVAPVLAQHPNWTFADQLVNVPKNDTSRDTVEQEQFERERSHTQKKRRFLHLLHSGTLPARALRIVHWESEAIQVQPNAYLGGELFSQLGNCALEPSCKVTEPDSNNPRLQCPGWVVTLPFDGDRILSALVAAQTAGLQKHHLRFLDNQPQQFPQVAHFEDAASRVWVGLRFEDIKTDLLNSCHFGIWDFAAIGDWYWVGELDRLLSLYLMGHRIFVTGLAQVMCDRLTLAEIIEAFDLGTLISQQIHQQRTFPVEPRNRIFPGMEPELARRSRQEQFTPEGFKHSLAHFLSHYFGRPAQEQEAIATLLNLPAQQFSDMKAHIEEQKAIAASQMRHSTRQQAMEVGHLLLQRKTKSELQALAQQFGILIHPKGSKVEILEALQNSERSQAVYESLFGLEPELPYPYFIPHSPNLATKTGTSI